VQNFVGSLRFATRYYFGHCDRPNSTASVIDLIVPVRCGGMQPDGTSRRAVLGDAGAFWEAFPRFSAGTIKTGLLEDVLKGIGRGAKHSVIPPNPP
jgi:hypothetical protein